MSKNRYAPSRHMVKSARHYTLCFDTYSNFCDYEVQNKRPESVANAGPRMVAPGVTVKNQNGRS